MNISLDSFLTTNFLFCSFAFASSIVLLSARNFAHRYINTLGEILLIVISQLSVFGLTYLVNGYTPELLFSLVLSTLMLLSSYKVLSGYSVIGKYFFTSNVLLLFFGLFWSMRFIATMPVSNLTRALMLGGGPLLILTLPSGIVQFIEQFEVLCRKDWDRPRLTTKIAPRADYPKISLHVPTYTEPPEIVIETLGILAKLDYPNFEVIVIDNNTKDEKLWKPVEEYCLTLGDRFRFFHVDGITGAKAGALNFALTKTHKDAEIIGVIDADYHAKPDFLKALVGFFDDPSIGFVQTPHDYRGWEDNAYLRMCYNEYKIFFHTTMVTLNERDAGLTVGTMCLIRKKALVDAGKWAEWCVTEDSELSIRIHAIGYSSVYLTQTFGKGLIPETFEGYKNQRFRWTAGPVQEFKHHFNLLMIWPWRKPSLLSFIQRVHHLNHGLDRFNVGISLLLTPLGFAVVGSMIFHREVVTVPFELWLGATVLLISGVYLNWMLYKITLQCSVKDTMSAIVASKALSHVISIASLTTIFRKSMPWHRTNKFATTSKLLRALSTTKTELILGITVLSLVVVGFALMPLPGLVLMFLIGLSYRGFNYLSAPMVAIFAEISNKNSSSPQHKGLLA